MAPAFQPSSSVWEWFSKGTMALPAFLSGSKLSSISHLEARHFSSSCRPLVTFKLLPQCCSLEGVSLSKSVYRFFKNCLGLQKFLPLTQAMLVFAARIYGDLSSWHWYPGLGDWCRSGTHCSQIFIHHMWMWDQPIPHLCLSYHGCGFFNSTVISLSLTLFLTVLSVGCSII